MTEIYLLIAHGTDQGEAYVLGWFDDRSKAREVAEQKEMGSVPRQPEGETPMVQPQAAGTGPDGLPPLLDQDHFQIRTCASAKVLCGPLIITHEYSTKRALSVAV